MFLNNKYSLKTNKKSLKLNFIIMREEKKFNKYEILGPDYHYQQINKKNRGTFNSFLYARYKILIDLIIQELKKLQKENQL